VVEEKRNLREERFFSLYFFIVCERKERENLIQRREGGREGGREGRERWGPPRSDWWGQSNRTMVGSERCRFGSILGFCP
jgi:hypothetical protein